MFKKLKTFFNVLIIIFVVLVVVSLLLMLLIFVGDGIKLNPFGNY